MANDSDPTTKLPPLENWAGMTFAYGFLLDRSSATDYTGNVSANGVVQFSYPSPDDIHLLNLNPQQYSEDEPIATSVDSSMGGGKVVESRGWIKKPCSIRGTTGLLPPIAPHAYHMKPPDTITPGRADIQDVSQASGFFEFYRLRVLFRKFMSDRKAGKSVQMHYLDFKADEFWLIEPSRFHLERGRFTYTYDIGFDKLTPSENASLHDHRIASRGVSTIDKGAQTLQALLRNPLFASFDSPTQQALTRLSQQYNSIKGFLATYASGVGVLTLKLQDILSKIDVIQSFFGDIASLRRGALDVPLTLYRQLYSSIQGLWDAFDDVTPEAFKADINEMLIEMQMLTEGLISHHARTYGTTPGKAMSDVNDQYTSQRGAQGTADQFMTENGSSSSPLIDPFVGASGLGLIGDLQKMIDTSVLRPEYVLTGENIFDVAQRLLKDGSRFIDLIVFNQLRSPYIVDDPTNKPDSTIAWGETILVPMVADQSLVSTAQPVSPATSAFNATVLADSVDFISVQVDTTDNPWRENMWAGFSLTFDGGPLDDETRVIVSNTEDTLVLNRILATNPLAGAVFSVTLTYFNARRPVTPEARAFGRDIMGVFQTVNGLITDGTVDIMLTSRHDLATVEGIENLQQAVALLLQSTAGSDKSNPRYGVASVIGRKFEPNIVALHTFYIRTALLADPRIAAVEQPKITFSGGVISFSCYIRPIQVQRTLYFSIPLAR